MTRARIILGLAFLPAWVACGVGDTEGLKTRPDGADDTGSIGGTYTDTGDPTNTGGPPGPNTLTTGDSERCLLLFGDTDRVVSNDVGLPFKTEPRTMQAWVRTNWDGEQVAVSYGRGSVGQGFTLGVVDGVGFVDANGTTRIRAVTRIDDDQWHHLVGVWDGVTALVIVDGVTDVVGQLTGSTASGGVAVGNRPEASPDRDPWIGWIDDVRIFSAARDPSTIGDDLEGIDDEGDLQLWYDFEVIGDPKGANVLIEDLSGQGHEGESAGQEDHPEFPFCR